MPSRSRAVILAAALILPATFVDLPAQIGGQPRQPAQQGQAGARQMRRDARETAPDALIGTWILNLAKSKYTGGNPPRSQVRNFDYTADGKVMCHGVTINANGSRSVFHWAVTLDGADHPEYMRGSGALVSALVGIKKTDERTLGITVRRHDRLIQTGEWKLSEDGRTLTQFLKNTTPNDQGVIREHIAVFDKAVDSES
jgi:hypothetical protein